MKKLFTLCFCAVLFTHIAYCQAPIPNGGFENWHVSSGANHPTAWSTSDQIVTGLPFGLSSPGGVSQESDPASVSSGSYSALLHTQGVAIPTLGNVTFAGSMTLGAYGFTLSSFQVTLGGVAYTDRPDSIEFSYKYLLPVGATDNGVVNVNLTRATTHDGTVTVGSATINTYYSSNFTTVKAKINYFSALAPDTLKMQAQSSAQLFMGGADDAKLWLDDMHFTGLDTVFKAYLFPKTSQVVCAGDPIAIRTDEIPGDSYVWFRDGNTLPNTTYKFTPTVTGGYSVLVSHEGALYVSDTVYVTVNPLPIVIYSGPQDTVCDTGSAIELTGGTPAGGTYAGDGVRFGSFYPENSPLGDGHVTYTYTDGNGCTVTSDNLSFYVAGCSLGVEILQSDAQVNVYPNPAFNRLFITGNDKVLGGTARIYDIQGRLIAAIDIVDHQTTVDLSSITAGWYSMIISDARNTSVAKAKVGVVK